MRVFFHTGCLHDLGDQAISPIADLLLELTRARSSVFCRNPLSVGIILRSLATIEHTVVPHHTHVAQACDFVQRCHSLESRSRGHVIPVGVKADPSLWRNAWTRLGRERRHGQVETYGNWCDTNCLIC